MSQNSHETFVPCIIERGGFSGERTFEIPVNEGLLIGTAHYSYFRDSNQKPLGPEQLGYGIKLTGFVQCRIIQRNSESPLVELPSSDVMHVPQNELVEIC